MTSFRIFVRGRCSLTMKIESFQWQSKKRCIKYWSFNIYTYFLYITLTRAGIGIPKSRKYREIPKFGIRKYQKFESRNFQYYWIPKILNTEFSILLNTEKNLISNFNNTENFGIITENTETSFINKIFFSFIFCIFFRYFLLVFSGFFWYFSL